MEIESLPVDFVGVALFLLVILFLYKLFSIVYPFTKNDSSSMGSSSLYFFSLAPGEILTLQTDSGYSGSLHVTRGSAMSENGEINEGNILDVGLSKEEISTPHEHTIQAGDQGLEGTWFVILLEH